ncbi:nucleobase:cation symporter-2 family protein [Kamptonema animale CS-326]|jgi:xanthine permease XanP|uniref:uracil-xanthine permease family protein n=1 Tax=Kamptonema animale TaxID=92934 RepID=UPI00232ACB6D|nr:nucleobase:cation symporter-2 family protein [Kamptonema animale]MDB9511566.1 nucleobase:cation symporter-2 family protein [Kamptonema animale CS-326]
MSHIEVHQMDENVVEKRHNLIYGLNDKPPFLDALFVALQHVGAIFIPIATPGLIICGALNFDVNTTSYILGMSLFVSGIATFIQARTFGPVGSGLLNIQGTSFAFVSAIVAVITTSQESGKTPEQTIALVLGLCFFGSFIPIILSRFLHLTQKIFTPLVTGTTVTLIGLTLIKVGMFYMAGGAAAKQNGTFGSLQNWALSGLVFAIVSYCSASTNKYLKMGSVVISLTIGFVISLALGIVDFSRLGGLPLINIPVPFRFGLAFDFATFIPFAILYIALTLEVVGDITATAMISGEPIKGGQFFRRLKGGILGDGVNSLLAACCSTFPVVTLAQNNGIIQLTGVGSRYVGYYVAAILTFLGLFPIIGGLLITIPMPVFGGAVMLMFGTVAVAGFNILRGVEMDNRSFVILAVALSTGLGVTFLPEAIHEFPPQLRSIFESGIATGSIFALVLNLIMPKTKELSKEEALMLSDLHRPVEPD